MLENQRILAVTDEFWDGFKRIRHRMPMLWAREGNRVLWLEQTPYPNQIRRGSASFWGNLRPRMREVEPGLFAATMPPAIPRMLKGGILGNTLRTVHRAVDKPRIRGYLKKLGWEPDMVVLFQQPVRHDYLAMFPHALKVYYCSDIYGYGQATPQEIEEEKHCCEKVDVVFTTAGIVRDRLIQYNPHTYHLPHAVDLQWWEENRDRVPEDYDRIPHPRAVFPGVISSRIDFDFMERVARCAPDWNFVYVGPVKQVEEQVKQLNALPNCHFLGERKWEDIPGYIAGADVLIFPYWAHATISHSGLPLKFYEFAISGHPILSTAFNKPELDNPDLMVIRTEPEGWRDYLADVRANRAEQDELSRLRRQLAMQNTYEARLHRQRELLELIVEEKKTK